MDRKDRNVKPGDSEIVTKKGFFMSMPSKKKKDSPEKSQKKEAPKPQSSPEKQKNGGQQKSNQNGHQGQSAHSEKNGQNGQNGHRDHGGKRRHGDRRNKHRGGKPSDEKQQNSNEREERTHEQQNNRSNNNGRKNKQRQPEKRAEREKIKPSILSDLGYSSEILKPKKAAEPEKDEKTEEIDYSKAIPLRDQIYPPKKEKKPLSDEEKEGKTEIIGVRFKEAGKIYYFDPDGNTVSFGTPVIVETARGVEYGFCAIANRFIPTDVIVNPLKKIVRIGNDADKARLDANKELEAQAGETFKEKVEKLGLEMNLVGVEYTFDNSKLLFYFSAEGRVDFRELVKELASVFRTRIELRQVGVRDEAKIMGGLGVCGRPLCCKTFLGEFAQVSIKMAKDQSLSLNSAKISGTCGRLLCCLRYEDEVYQQEYERTPKVDALVETPEGKGVVVEANALKGIVKVRLDSKKEASPQPFHRDDVKILGYIKRGSTDEEKELKQLEE